MKFSLWTNYGALNSSAVFNAFEKSLKEAGHTVVYNDNKAPIAVIWSVLWHGRMAPNKQIWNIQKQRNLPIVVLEVGSIKRGTTWKVAVNGVNRDAYFGEMYHDKARAEDLGIKVHPWTNSGDHILICGQHDKSQQWMGMPSAQQWLRNTITDIRKHTDRPIVVRQHPRCNLYDVHREFDNVTVEQPKKIDGSYDDFDLSFDNAWAVVNWSSNPALEAVLKGIPVYVSEHSLAWDVGNNIHDFSNIEDPNKPDRQQWANDYAHTEYTIAEIESGMPLKNLTKKL
jgi:hypothetical protein